MSSFALSRSFHPTRNLVITYLPSLSVAATYFRSFCSDYDRPSRTVNVAISVESVSDKNERLPETSWGPLGAGDARFPLPGQMGIANADQEAAEETPEAPALFLRGPKPSDLLTVQLPFDRHVDVFHQLKHQIPTLMKERSREAKMESSETLEQRLLQGPDYTPEIPPDAVAGAPSDAYLLECRFFDCPTLLKKDFNALFPTMDFTNSNFTVITLCQKTVNDMMGWSEEIEAEREELLHSFFDAAQSMADTLKGAGFWADFIDPSSGKPFLSAHSSATMLETDDRFRHLGFEIEDLACCKVVRHHEWGTHAYVGCVFTTAPMDHPVIKEISAKL